MSSDDLSELSGAVGNAVETDASLRELVRSLRRVAVVGASNNQMRAAARVPAFLVEQGIEIIPVTTQEVEVLGLPAVRDLTDVDGPVDLVDVFCRPDVAPEISAAAVAMGATRIWFQDGIVSRRAAEIAESGGLEVVMDRCLEREYRRLVLGEERPAWFPV